MTRLLFALLLLTTCRFAAAEALEIEHAAQDIEGWTVHVDVRLLSGEHKSLGTKSLRILANKLYEVSLVVPERPLAELRKVPIWLDLDHPLGNMQYHPSRQWLIEHDHDPEMAQCVHIPRAERLVKLQRPDGQPAVVLHELAHAYHDRVLGFENALIKQAFEKARDGKAYESVLHIDGRTTRHYALTNHKEFFAEMTEAFFDTNDFYPFVRGELRTADPETFHMLQSVWDPK